MEVSFKTKEVSSRFVDNEVTELAEFLMENNIYLTLAFSILDQKRHKIINSMDRVIESNLNCNDELKKNTTYSDFIKKMANFYNTDRDTLNSRRGALLELIFSNMKPINKPIKSFKIIEEALVLHKGIELSPKDIDFVFEYEQHELFECKATLTNFLRDPLDNDKIDKLNLIYDTKKLIKTYKRECNIYLVTYGENTTRCRTTLDSPKYNFNEFEIITGQMIIANI